MTDLVAELRELVRNYPRDFGWVSTRNRMSQAADEIERLTAELGVAKALGEKWAPVLNERDDAIAERDRLRAALERIDGPDSGLLRDDKVRRIAREALAGSHSHPSGESAGGQRHSDETKPGLSDEGYRACGRSMSNEPLGDDE